MPREDGWQRVSRRACDALLETHHFTANDGHRRAMALMPNSPQYPTVTQHERPGLKKAPKNRVHLLLFGCSIASERFD